MSALIHKGKKIAETVATPVRGILTQAEFDALPEEERSRGLYVVDNGQSGGGSSIEVYDGAERVIGTWFGKPLYRRSFKAVSPSTAGESSIEVVHVEIPVDTMVNIYGCITTQSNQFCPIPFYLTNKNCVFIAYNPPTHASNPNSLRIACGIYNVNLPLVLTLEYTKTTDPEVSG